MIVFLPGWGRGVPQDAPVANELGADQNFTLTVARTVRGSP
jgi:hypothetical protein